MYRLWQAAIELGRQNDEFLRELRNIASETQSVRPGILRMQLEVEQPSAYQHHKTCELLVLEW